MEKIPYSWTGRINATKMPPLPKSIYRVDEIPIKVAMVFLIEIEKTILKFVLVHERP